MERRPGRSPAWLVFTLLSAALLLLGLTACSNSGLGTSTPSGSSTEPNTTQGGASANGPRLNFKASSYEIGPVSRGNDKGKEYRISFTNTGNAPLTISDTKVEPLD